MDPRSGSAAAPAPPLRDPAAAGRPAADDLLAEATAGPGLELARRRAGAVGRPLPGRSRFDTRAPTGAWTSAVLFPAQVPRTDRLPAGQPGRPPARRRTLPGRRKARRDRAREASGWPPTASPANWIARGIASSGRCVSRQAPAEPDLHALAQRYSLPLADGELRVVSLPGCSAMAAWIAAALLLLGQLQALPGGHLLDFGCGAGVLGAALKRRYPASRLTLLDVDAFAVESSRLTLAANGLDGEVIAADGIDGAPRELAAIVSNPPFHQGVHRLPGLRAPAAARRRAPGAGRRTAPGRQQLPEVPAVDRTPPRPLPDTRRRRRFPHLLRPSLLISAWNPVNEAFPLPARTPAARPFRGHPPEAADD